MQVIALLCLFGGITIIFLFLFEMIRVGIFGGKVK